MELYVYQCSYYSYMFDVCNYPAAVKLESKMPYDVIDIVTHLRLYKLRYWLRFVMGRMAGGSGESCPATYLIQYQC